MIDPFVIVAVVFGVVGFMFVLANLALIGRLLRGERLEYAEKKSPYECGEIAVGDAWIRFNPRFLIIAVVFVLFDIEIAFLFPWATAYKGAFAGGTAGTLGLIAFIDMLVFVFILLVGYVWFWRLGELRWILPKEQSVDGDSQ
ncbi:MAG: NADH-quinone oxidoreductase subunit A [Candidatus Lindowbacteria bacterium]|nr:NADH-quinone oxidoreductase subunit A [Candidatus Lindowbacteria bacterium]